MEDNLKFFEFMDPSNTDQGGSFYWPVAPGDSWYPNIQLWEDPKDPHPNAWTPRDLVHVLARPIRKHRHGGGEILFWKISLWGGDDHSMTTQEYERGKYGHRLTLAEVKEILRRFPNPLSLTYLETLQKDGRPLFITY